MQAVENIGGGCGTRHAVATSGKPVEIEHIVSYACLIEFRELGKDISGSISLVHTVQRRVVGSLHANVYTV